MKLQHLIKILLIFWIIHCSCEIKSGIKEAKEHYVPYLTCMGKIHKEVKICNEEAKPKSFNYFQKLLLGSDYHNRVICCGTWMLRDCWVKAAKKKCTVKGVYEIHNSPFIHNPNLTLECQDYPQDLSRCKIPWWLYAIFVIGLAVVFAIVAYTCYWLYCCWQKRETNYDLNPTNESYRNESSLYKTDGRISSIEINADDDGDVRSEDLPI